MKLPSKYKSGWHNDSHRHFLAAKYGAAPGKTSKVSKDAEYKNKIDLNKYAGDWKQKAVYPEPFYQKGLKEVKAHYTVNPDGTVKVVNEGIDKFGKVQQIEGTAYSKSKDNRKLEVEFGNNPISKLFMRGEYQIVDVDPNYKKAVVRGGDGTVWILQKDNKTYKALKFKHGDEPDSKFDPAALRQGTEVETEHTDDKSVAKQIAKAHLDERSDYYQKLEQLEMSKPGKQTVVSGIPIIAEKVKKGNIYPVDTKDVAKELKRQDPEDIKGIKAIEFVNPNGPQKDAWGQFVRSKRTIYLFSQPYKDGKIDGQKASNVRKHITDYVIPHEIGHYVALSKRKLIDKDLRVAEARADAHVVGMDVNDKDIHKLVRK
jgi:lipocalin